MYKKQFRRLKSQRSKKPISFPRSFVSLPRYKNSNLLKAKLEDNVTKDT